MAINTEITRISNAKSDIKSAIEAKGVSVPSNALIDTYDDYVAQISGGGGNKMGQFVDVDPSATYSGGYAIGDFVEEVVVPEGITGIIDNPSSNQYTFRGFTKLKSVSLPSTLTKLANQAFRFCRSLTTITIPSGVTSIGTQAFNGCVALPSINIPSGLTSILGSTFSGCTSLASVTFDSPSSVTNIGEKAFSACEALTSINIPSSVTNIGEYAFNGCVALPSINIPSGVTSIGQYAFQICVALTTVTCEAVNPPTLGTNAFNYCSSLTHIYVPSASVETYKAASGWDAYASIIEAIPTA